MYDILAAGWAAAEASESLALQFAQELRLRFPAPFCERSQRLRRHYLKEAGFAGAPAELAAFLRALSDRQILCSVREAGEGGIFSALWDLAEKEGCGFSISMKKIPICQETVEICEYFGINPYGARSGGMFLLTAEDGGEALRVLTEAGILAEILGELRPGRDKLLRQKEHVRCLNRPQQDSLQAFLARKERSSGDSVQRPAGRREKVNSVPTPSVLTTLMF